MAAYFIQLIVKEVKGLKVGWQTAGRSSEDDLKFETAPKPDVADCIV